MMAYTEIILPWPDRVLSPNSRAHWAKKHKARKQSKSNAYYATIATGLYLLSWPPGRLHLWIDGYAPDKRRRDIDNMLSALKGSLDGVALALDVDDSRFVPHPFIKDETRSPGEIRVRITAGPDT